MSHKSAATLTFLVVFVCLHLASCKTTMLSQDNSVERCIDSGDTSCLMFNFVKNMDKISKRRSFRLLEGISLEQIPGTERLSSGRAITDAELDATLPEMPNEREAVLTDLVEDKFSNLINSKALTISLDSIIPGASVRITRSEEDDTSLNFGLDFPEDNGRAISEARTKLKKILPLLLLFKYKAAMLGALGLVAVAALAGKALLVSKLALFLAGIIGIKKLASHDEHHSAYSYVSYPSYHGHGGYHRSLIVEEEEPQQRAYRSH